MRTDSEDFVEQIPPEKQSRLHKILEILFQGRQIDILQFLDRIREYIKNSFPMTLFTFIADFYKTCREMFGNYHLEMHDPVELLEMYPEEEVEDTAAMFSDVLRSLRRVDVSKGEKTVENNMDPPGSYENVLEKQYQEFLEDINIQISSIQPENTGLQDPVFHHQEVNGGSTVSIDKPSSLKELIREEATSLSDPEEDDDELRVQEEFQRKLAEQNQRYQEELETIRQRRRQQQ